MTISSLFFKLSIVLIIGLAVWTLLDRRGLLPNSGENNNAFVEDIVDQAIVLSPDAVNEVTDQQNIVLGSEGEVSFWRNDMERIITAKEKAILNSKHFKVSDLGACSQDEGIELLQSLIYKYGTLLKNWVTISNAAEYVKKNQNLMTLV